MNNEENMMLAFAGIADALEQLAKAIREIGTTPTKEAEPEPKKKAKKAEVKESAPETATEPEETKAEEPVKELTLTDVRGALAEKSRQGYVDEVKALIAKYGAQKLSDVDPKDYAAIMTDAEVIGNA